MKSYQEWYSCDGLITDRHMDQLSNRGFKHRSLVGWISEFNSRPLQLKAGVGRPGKWELVWESLNTILSDIQGIAAN